MFKQTESDKKQVKFFEDNIPQMLEIDRVKQFWHKYKTKRSIETNKEVNESYIEMKKIVDVFCKFLDKLFKDFNFQQPLKREKFKSDIIMYWHQGNNMPECSRLCYKSFLKNQHRSISLLSYEDVKTLVKIDKNVEDAFNKGNIGYAVYSDYLRMLLLEKYDVMWVDSTIFCIDEIPSEFFSQKFWSIKGNYMSGYAEKVKALTYDCKFGQVYLLAGKDNLAFSKVRQMFEEYFKHYDINFTYFMTYVFFEWLYRNDSIIKQEIDELKENNTKVEYLTCSRDFPLDDNLLKDMLSNDTVFYKLSNRIEYDYSDKTFIGQFIKKHMKGE